MKGVPHFWTLFWATWGPKMDPYFEPNMTGESMLGAQNRGPKMGHFGVSGALGTPDMAYFRPPK